MVTGLPGAAILSSSPTWSAPFRSGCWSGWPAASICGSTGAWVPPTRCTVGLAGGRDLPADLGRGWSPCRWCGGCTRPDRRMLTGRRGGRGRCHRGIRSDYRLGEGGAWPLAGAMLATAPWTVAIVVPLVAPTWRSRIVSPGSRAGSPLAGDLLGLRAVRPGDLGWRGAGGREAPRSPIPTTSPACGPAPSCRISG
jgi:hypothetical protein